MDQNSKYNLLKLFIIICKLPDYYKSESKRQLY